MCEDRMTLSELIEARDERTAQEREDRMNRRLRERSLTSMTAAEWNELYPIGTRVRYHSIIGQHVCGESCIESRTRSAAWDLGLEPVVKIEGKAGGVSLQALRVLIQE